ncbi:hypothetical protein MUK42_18200 [Musa troglodytarum]|uniref:Uncharacterized protein n=1 Tax=Musa troglodytarum TaxID=320322 RepID=A0A9E7L7A7_9LILI|nr:hypothetical protein MUK42_18200 [Musa troglodytarum]
MRADLLRSLWGVLAFNGMTVESTAAYKAAARLSSAFGSCSHQGHPVAALPSAPSPALASPQGSVLASGSVNLLLDTMPNMSALSDSKSDAFTSLHRRLNMTPETMILCLNLWTG